jgi:hypothetical protein
MNIATVVHGYPPEHVTAGVMIREMGRNTRRCLLRHFDRRVRAVEFVPSLTGAV